MKKKTVIIIIVVLAVLLVFGLSGGRSALENDDAIDSTDVTETEAAETDATEADTDGSSSETKKEKYTVENEALVDEGYGYYSITGTLTNNTDKKVSYIQVEYVLKDAEGYQIGTGLANTNNLAAESSWKFDAYCAIEGDAIPDSFELVEVTAW